MNKVFKEFGFAEPFGVRAVCPKTCRQCAHHSERLRHRQNGPAHHPRQRGMRLVNADIADTGLHSVSRCARRDHSAYFGIYG